MVSAEQSIINKHRGVREFANGLMCKLLYTGTKEYMRTLKSKSRTLNQNLHLWPEVDC